MSNALSRRTVLKSTFGIPFVLGAGWRAAEKPKIALIGCGGMGNGDASNAKRFGTIAAVCDVDATRAETTAKKFEGAKAYHDFRKLLDVEKDISIIINATPDHWHTLVNLAALKAGKDIYSEKPLTLTIDEGKRLVAAVKDSKRVLQTGSQQRSDKLFRQACLLIRAGRLGKLSTVTSTLPAGLRGGPFKPSAVPKGLDWDMWQGQTQEVDFVTERCFTNFRFWREYSGGTITDWGAHHNDIVLWATGKDRSGPTSVEGKRLVEPIPGGYTTVPEYEVTLTYADGLTHICKSTTANTIFGGTNNKPVPRSQTDHGVKFEGDDGWLFVTRGKIEASRPEMLKDKLSAEELKVYVSDDHMKNFFDCVESRKAPICEAEIGHRSATVCHLGGIALQLGRKLTWDPAKEEFVGDKEANGYVAREQRKKWSYETI
jgi:predicted dehydrogenase